MYKEKDIVTYGSQGVCRITAITEKNFEGDIHEYYELVPVYDKKSTFFVPLANTALISRMHHVLPAGDIKKLIKSIRDEKVDWIDDESVRKEKYKELIDSGDRKALIRAIKALHAHKLRRSEIGKNIHVCDEQFLKDAEKVLFDEFAFVLNIDRDKILDYINSFIKQAELA